MFSNGKFKNIVSSIDPKEDCPVDSGESLDKIYTLLPTKGSTKNWIALEESFNRLSSNLAPTIASVSNNII